MRAAVCRVRSVCITARDGSEPRYVGDRGARAAQGRADPPPGRERDAVDRSFDTTGSVPAGRRPTSSSVTRSGGTPATVTSRRSAWIVIDSISSSTITRRSRSLAFSQIASKSTAGSFPHDGSYMRRSQVSLFCELLGIGDPGPILREVWSRLDTVVIARNDIAHGTVTPDEVGRRYSVDEVRALAYSGKCGGPNSSTASRPALRVATSTVTHSHSWSLRRWLGVRWRSRSRSSGAAASPNLQAPGG